MSDVDQKDRDLVKSVVEEVLKGIKPEATKAEDSKGLEIEEKEIKPESTNGFLKSVIGAISGKSLADLDFNDKSKDAFADWKLLTLDLYHAVISKNYGWLAAYQQKVQPNIEGSNAYGGFLVPTEFLAEVQQLAVEQEAIYPNARIRPMTGHTLDIPAQTGHGPKFVNTAEAAVKSTTSVEYTNVTLTADKAAFVLAMSDEFLADAKVNVMDDVMQQTANALAIFRDNAFVNSSGNIAGIDSYTFVSIAAGGALTGDHLISAYFRSKAYYRTRAVWLMHSRSVELVRGLKDQNNNYLLGPLGQGGLPTILGRPVVTCDAVDQDKIFFIDLSTYIVGERQGMTVDISTEATLESGSTPYSLWQRDLTGLRVVVRYGGGMAVTDGCVEIDDIRS